MEKRVFIIHGWGGNPDEPWMAWLKSELKKRDIKVIAPQMPDTENPQIESWIPFLAKSVGSPDDNTCFVGHSIGCQTILRYLQTINTEVDQVCLVAPWFSLKEDSYKDVKERAMAKPWIETPIDFEKIKSVAKNIYAIMSEDDYHVPIETSNILVEKLHAHVTVESNKQHYSPGEADKIPQILAQLL